MAKRRAATRRRNRDMLRRVGAIFFVILFVLGTATTIFVFQSTPTASPSTDTGAVAGSTSIPISTVVPAGSAAAIASTPNGAQANDLVKQAQDAANQGKWQDAISFYKAALGLSPGNASIEYELGKAYIQTKDYGSAVDHLQKAEQLNPQAAFSSDAQNLINTYKGQVTSGVAGTPGTSPTTSTTPATR